jgi:hypothetical protein
MQLLTPELEKKIKNSGGKIYYVTLEEFQELIAKGQILNKNPFKKVE